MMPKVLLILLLLLISVTSGQARDLQSFIDQLRQCVQGKQELSIGVLGVPQDDARLSALEALVLRRQVERRLARQGIRLRPVADLEKLVQQARQRGEDAPEQLGVLLRKAQEVDALIHVNIIRTGARNDVGRKVAYRLVAIANAPSGKPCLATSPEQTTTIRASAVRDFDRIMRVVLEHLLDRHPDIATIRVMDFRVLGFYGSECSTALVDRGIGIAKKIAAGPNFLLKDRTLKAVHIGPHEKGGGKRDLVILGDIMRGPEGKGMKLRVRFIRGTDYRGPYHRHTAVLHALDVPVTNLRCDTTPPRCRQRLIHGARPNHSLFTITAPRERVKVGAPVEFRLHLQSAPPRHLHCLVVDLADCTALLLIPRQKTGAALIQPGRPMTYPEDFGFWGQNYQRPSDNFFGCLALPTPLPRELRKRWHALTEQPSLPSGTIVHLLEQLRRQKNAVEAWKRVVVDPR